jgi:DNA polymerase (family 10)
VNNKEIAGMFKLAGKLTELHDGNDFKVKSYMANAFKIERLPQPLEYMSAEEIAKIEGIGKGTHTKINEIISSGTLKDLDELIAQTPVGVLEMLSVKGLGPKKVRTIWKELEVESVGELLYACNENRLVTLKGFGEKTQDEVIKSIEFLQANTSKFLYAKLEPVALQLIEAIEKSGVAEQVSLTGEIRRRCSELEKIELIATIPDKSKFLIFIESIKHPEQEFILSFAEENSGVSLSFILNNSIPVKIFTCEKIDFYSTIFKTTGSAQHLELLGNPQVDKETSEEEIYKKAGWNFIIPELREGKFEKQFNEQNKLKDIVELSDLRGILHNHTTYSDGVHTLEQMANYCKELGYEYLGISDHSQYAVYAKGLKPEQIIQQHKEVDFLNEKLKPFRIFKGIEADILPDGSLDYNDEILASFDFTVASIHSAMKMDEAKATVRLIRAIENPHTTILGHPTGRLLLSRPGYPIDHKKVIDACAANNVVIELNANPHRLDIDWIWIPYCMEKGVMISINPDAHKMEGYHDMHYGSLAARKGGLTKQMTFNALSLEEIEKWFLEKKK